MSATAVETKTPAETAMAGAQLKSHSTRTIPLILWILLFPGVYSKSTVKPMVHLASTTPFCAHAVNFAAWRADRSLLKLAAL